MSVCLQRGQRPTDPEEVTNEALRTMCDNTLHLLTTTVGQLADVRLLSTCLLVCPIYWWLIHLCSPNHLTVDVVAPLCFTAVTCPWQSSALITPEKLSLSTPDKILSKTDPNSTLISIFQPKPYHSKILFSTSFPLCTKQQEFLVTGAMYSM